MSDDFDIEWEGEGDIFPEGWNFDDYAQGFNDEALDPELGAKGWLCRVYNDEGVACLQLTMTGLRFLAKCAVIAKDHYDLDAILNINNEATETTVTERWGFIRYCDEMRLLPTEIGLPEREVLMGTLIVLGGPAMMRLAKIFGLGLEEIAEALVY